ncbi:hypothetical protein GBAR_LOCUS14264, partial [Geodia barretti]
GFFSYQTLLSPCEWSDWTRAILLPEAVCCCLLLFTDLRSRLKLEPSLEPSRQSGEVLKLHVSPPFSCKV